VQVDVGRRAVVHQRPHDLQAVPGRGPRHRLGTAQVVAPWRRLADSPSDTLAHAAQAAIRGAGVVGLEVLEVARGKSHVERRAQAVAVVGAFEPAHPEGLEGRTAGALA